MKFKKECCLNKGIPKNNWRDIDKNITDEFKIRVTWNARSFIKVLIFKNITCMRRFWKNTLGSYIEKNVLGVVHELGYEKITFHPDGSETSTKVFDKNIVCIMGLLRDEMTYEFIVHESIHAACRYSERTKSFTKKWPGEDEMPEERICYAGGRIARIIIQHCQEANIKITHKLPQKKISKK